MNQQYVPTPGEVLGPLAYEWSISPATAAEKFRQFIEYHEAVGHKVQACVYRCALVQLSNGRTLDVIDGMGLDDAQLKKLCGV